MKWKILGVLWLMFFLYIFNYVNVLAQTPPPASPAPVVPTATAIPPSTAPTQTPVATIDINKIGPTSPAEVGGLGNIVSSSCGFAGNSPASKCCGDPKDVGSVDEYNKDAKGPSTDLGSVLDWQSLFSSCYVGVGKATPGSANGCTCVLDPNTVPAAGIQELCKRFGGRELDACNACAAKGQLLTGMGCVPLQMQEFINIFLLPKAIGLAGIISFFCILVAAFRIQISRGEKEALQKSREMLTACIMGLLLIIFAVFILKVIGVNILGLPNLK